MHVLAQSPFDIGGRVSGNYNWLINGNFINDDGIKYDLNVGHSIGVKGGIDLYDDFGIALEASYQKFNQTILGNTEGPSWRKKINLSYIDFPLMFRYKNSMFFVEAGPMFSLLVGAEDEFIHNENVIPNLSVKYANAESRFERFNYGLTVGGGVAISEFEAGNLFLGARFAWLTSDVINNEVYYNRQAPPNNMYPFAFFPAYKSGNNAGVAVPNIPLNVMYLGITLDLNYDFSRY
jgi:hypothetical protein